MADTMVRECIIGKVASGKTEALVHRVVEYLSDQSNDKSVLVLAASPDAAETLKRRLAAALGIPANTLGERGVRVSIPRAIALEVLGNPKAQAACGRKPRLLLPFEESILLEDVKASGLRPKRLREMLKFFYRSWTELADDDPSWLVSEEEVQVHSLLKECLAFTGGILPNELANLAVKWLRCDEASRETSSYDLVLVDDYQLLSRASQVFAGLLAREGLIVTGDMQATSEVFEEYPSLNGLIELAEADGVETTNLDACRNSATVHACCENLIDAARKHEQESRDLTGMSGNGGREARAIAGMNEDGGREARDLAGNSEDGGQEARALAGTNGVDGQEARALAGTNGVGGQEARALASANNESAQEPATSRAKHSPAAVVEASTHAASAETGLGESSAGYACALSFPTAEAEIAHIAQHIADAIEKGAQPGDFYLAAPNGVWAKALSRSLKARGIPTAQEPSTRGLNGDPRDLGRCKTLRLFTLLALVARPHDMLAWRSWCGFGDWLTDNPGFAALRRYAARHSLAPYDALATVATGNPCREAFGELDAAEQASLERIVQAFESGQEILGQLEGLVGRQLVNAAWSLLGCEAPAQDTTPAQEDVPAELLGLLGVAHTDLAQDAASLVGHLLATLREPCFPRDAETVRIGDLTATHGASFKTVVLSGFVNGFIPKHAYFDPVKTPLDRMGILFGADARRVYQAAGCAREELLVTAFTQMDALQAERLDLKVDRVFMREGKRLARISPSELICSMCLEVQETRA